LEERPAGITPPSPRTTASASVGADTAAHVLDGRSDTVWRAPAGTQTLQIDFGVPREFNGLALRWARDARAVDYDIEASDDGHRWTTLRRVRGAGGERNALFLPESEARFLRLKLLRALTHQYALAEITLPDYQKWPTLNAMLAALASDLPRGNLP